MLHLTLVFFYSLLFVSVVIVVAFVFCRLMLFFFILFSSVCFLRVLLFDYVIMLGLLLDIELRYMLFFFSFFQLLW